MKKALTIVVLAALASTGVHAQTYIQTNLGINQFPSTTNYVEWNNNDTKINTSYISKAKDRHTYGRLAVGYDMGSIRYALDYTYYHGIDDLYTTTTNDIYELDGSANGNLVDQIATTKAKVRMPIHSLGLSAFYDIETTSALTPYVGVRVAANDFLALNKTLISERTVPVPPTPPTDPNVEPYQVIDYSRAQKHNVTVDASAFLGAQYQLTPSVAADLALEYGYAGTTVNDDQGLNFSQDIINSTSVTKNHRYGVNVGLRYNF